MKFDDNVVIFDSDGDEISLTIEEAKELQQRLNDKFGVEYETIGESIETFDISLPLTMPYCQIIPVTPFTSEPVEGVPYECTKHGLSRRITGAHPDDILVVIRPNESE